MRKLCLNNELGEIPFITKKFELNLSAPENKDFKIKLYKTFRTRSWKREVIAKNIIYTKYE